MVYYSPLGRRIMAALIDTVCLGIVSYQIAYIFFSSYAVATDYVLLVMSLLYFSYYHSAGGQTLGKRLLGIIVVQEANLEKVISSERAIIRALIYLSPNILSILYYLCLQLFVEKTSFDSTEIFVLRIMYVLWFFILLLQIANSDTKQAYYDRIAGSVVVDDQHREVPLKEGTPNIPSGYTQASENTTNTAQEKDSGNQFTLFDE